MSHQTISQFSQLSDVSGSPPTSAHYGQRDSTENPHQTGAAAGDSLRETASLVVHCQNMALTGSLLAILIMLFPFPAPILKLANHIEGTPSSSNQGKGQNCFRDKSSFLSCCCAGQRWGQACASREPHPGVDQQQSNGCLCHNKG